MKEILIGFGLRIIFEDDYNWIFDDPQDAKSEPLTLPKVGDVLAVDVMMDTLLKLRMNFGAYLALKGKVLGKDWHFLNEAQMKARAASRGKPN